MKKLSLVTSSSAWLRKAAQHAVFYLCILAILPSQPLPSQTEGSDLAVSRLQPLLRQIALERPNDLVQVIVQKQPNASAPEAQVAHLGGKVTTDLQIIHAFVAKLPAKALDKLAQLEGVRWVSWDAPVQESVCTQCVDTSKLINAYIYTVRAADVWNRSPYLQGQGIGVAVVDSGINTQADHYTTAGVNRIVAAQAFNTGNNVTVYDNYGHGSHVAGVIGGDGSQSSGVYIGVAPMVNIINVKVGDDLNNGQGTASTVVAGLQWILQNKSIYNIRVVNMSLNSAVVESYHTSPIDAAIEILWFNKIVVVVSAGNAGIGALYPPANDPFVITVGATDDRGTNSISDDIIPSFSAYGTTNDGFAKPDLVAPGVSIVGVGGNANQGMQASHPENKVLNGAYFRLSGTSAAAPVVAGAVALLLQDEPSLTPDQVKYRLMATANKSWSGYNAAKAGAGYLDISAAVLGTSTQNANTNVRASQLLWSGSQPVIWSSVNWNSVNWNSVNWNSVNWNSVNWNSVNWNSDYWGPTSRSLALGEINLPTTDGVTTDTTVVDATDTSDVEIDNQDSSAAKIFLPVMAR